MNPLLEEIVSNDTGRAKKAEEVLKKELPRNLLPQLLELAICHFGRRMADAPKRLAMSYSQFYDKKKLWITSSDSIAADQTWRMIPL